MTRRRVIIEGRPIWLQSDLALVPVVLWTSGPDGWHTADPVAVITATADGTRRLEIAGIELSPGRGQAMDAGPEDPLFEAQRAALVHAVCPPVPGHGRDRELWHCAWQHGLGVGPRRTRRLGRLTWHDSEVQLVPTVEPPAPCPCPRHRPPN